MRACDGLLSCSPVLVAPPSRWELALHLTFQSLQHRSVFAVFPTHTRAHTPHAAADVNNTRSFASNLTLKFSSDLKAAFYL